MSETSDSLTTWECKPEVKEKPLEELRVGDEFLLVCTGEELTDKLLDTVTIKMDSPSQKQNDKNQIKDINKKGPKKVPLKELYKLKIKEVHLSDYSRLDLVVTSYVPGKHEITGRYLKDTNTKVLIEPFPLEVRSVIKKEQGAPPPQVIGPMGPIDLGYPIWVMGLMIILLIVIFSYSYKFIKKYNDKKRLLNDLLLKDSHLTPLQEFSKEIRALSRESKILEKARKSPFSPLDFINGIKRSYNMYFARKFKIPAHIWTQKQTLGEFKSKNKKMAHHHYDAIKQYFTELEKAEQNINQMSFEDCRQLSEMGLQIVSKVHMTEKESL